MISRIDYKNPEKETDFEIVDLQLFFASRPHSLLKRDSRLNFWVIMVITEGSGDHYVDFIHHSVKKGDVVFILKNQVHHFGSNKDLQGYIIHINEPFFYRIEGFSGDIFLEFADRAFGSPVLSFDISKHSTKRTIIDLIYKEYFNYEENFNIELIASLFQSFILACRTSTREKDRVFLSKDYEHFKLFRQLVEENYTETRNVEKFADMMNVSRKTINQATRNVTGLSAKQFIINRIILEIKRYLSQGELLTYEIADTLGFDEAANMSNFFTRYEGVSPKDFRNNNLS